MKRATKIICLCLFVSPLLGCSYVKVEPISQNDVQSITVTELFVDKESLLCDDAQIRHFIKAFNSARLFRNDWETTDPLCADVLFTDGTHLLVWGGSTEGYLAMVKTDAQGVRGEQQNIQSLRLDIWFAKMLRILQD